LRFFNVRAENFPVRKLSGQKIRAAVIFDRPYPVRSVVRGLVTVYALLQEGVETTPGAGPSGDTGYSGRDLRSDNLTFPAERHSWAKNRHLFRVKMAFSRRRDPAPNSSVPAIGFLEGGAGGRGIEQNTDRGLRMVSGRVHVGEFCGMHNFRVSYSFKTRSRIDKKTVNLKPRCRCRSLRRRMRACPLRPERFGGVEMHKMANPGTYFEGFRRIAPGLPDFRAN
jgi:hypothetical protein